MSKARLIAKAQTTPLGELILKPEDVAALQKEARRMKRENYQPETSLRRFERGRGQ